MSGEVLWGPQEVDPLMSLEELKQLAMPMAVDSVDLLCKDALLPTDGRLSHVLERGESLVELTLVVRAEALPPQIPQGLYISELNNHRLSRWDLAPATNPMAAVVLGGLGRGQQLGQLAGPRGICGHNGAIYVAEQQKVSCWYPQSKGFCIPGDIFVGTKTLPFLEPSGLCVHDGWLYVADSKTHMVSRWMLKDASVGQLVAGGQGPGDGLEQLNRPTAVAVDAAGRAYVSDFGNDRVTRWPLGSPGPRSGEVVAGGRGEGDGLEQLAGPMALALQETKGKSADTVAIVVCEMGNHRITQWWPGQSRCELLVGGPGTCPELEGPQGVALDEDGSIWVTEKSSNRVTRWRPSSHGEVMAGGKGRGDDLDQLNGPLGILLVRKMAREVAGKGILASPQPHAWYTSLSGPEAALCRPDLLEASLERFLARAGAMPLQSSHVFASHIGHTGKTTLAYQMSSYFASKHPDVMVLIMDLAEEGDLTKRLLGGVDAAAEKVESLFGGVFRLLQAAEKRPSGLTSWLWSSKFEVMEHAVKLKDHNPALPENLYLISSGAYPRQEPDMSDEVRTEVVARIRKSLDEWIATIFLVELRSSTSRMTLRVCTVTAAVRTLPERIAVGECIESMDANVSLYAVKVSNFPDPIVTAAEADVTAAALISVAYGNHFKVLTEELAKEQYILTQCGTSQPTDEEVNAIVSGTGYQRKHFSVPVQSLGSWPTHLVRCVGSFWWTRVTADSTTILAFLKRLGVEDRVAYADAYAVHSCWQKAASCGSALESGWNGNATKREEQLNNVEVVFMDCNTDCSNVRARSNAVHVPVTKDNGNLHSAEYIKFLAAFFNLEELALRTFQDTVNSYSGLGQATATSPVVAWIQWNGWYSRYELSQATFKLQLVTAAGGRNVDAAQLAQSVSSMAVEDAVAGNAGAGKTYYVQGDDKAAAANALLAAMQDVDIVVDETYGNPGAYNYSSFLSTFYLTSQSTQKFLTAQKVLRVDRIYNSLGGLDWFESRLAYPDWAARGLARYVMDDASQQRSYFRNVALGEVPELVTAETCPQSLPSCDASYATPIGITTEASKSFQSVPALVLVMLGLAALSATTWKLFCDTDGDRRPSLAEKSLGKKFLRLVLADGRELVDKSESLQSAGLQEGDCILAIVLQVQVASTLRAFALWCCGGDRIITWGDPDSGGDSSAVQDQLGNLRSVQQVQATWNAFAAILSDGSVITWGSPDSGGDSSAVQEQLCNVKQIQATHHAFAAILADGSVVSWGQEVAGGDSSEVQHQLRSVQQIQATSRAFAAILADGSVVSWGSPAYGGDNSAVKGKLRSVKQVQATGYAFAALLSDGSVVTWGDRGYGGNSSAVRNQLRNVRQIQATDVAFAAILADGSVVTWGQAALGGDSSAVQDLLGNTAQIQAADRAFAAISTYGTVVSWGDLALSHDCCTVEDQLRTVREVQAAAFAFAAILEDGSVATWGDRAAGGDSHVVRDQLRSVQQLQATRYAFAAIRTDRSVVTWGDGAFGGDSSEVEPHLKGVQQIHATHYAFAAILADGSVVTWGDPGAGGDCSRVRHQLTGPYTLLAYGLCDQAIVPLHLNKGDLDRTETMLGVMNEYRQRGVIQTQVLFIVWNFVKVQKDEPMDYRGMPIPFTPTKVCMDILESCNARLYRNAQELPGLFVHTPASQVDFIKCSTAVLRVLADNVLKPSEELGLPVAEMEARISESGKKTMKFQSGDIAYDAKGETISNVMDGLKQLEEKFEVLSFQSFIHWIGHVFELRAPLKVDCRLADCTAVFYESQCDIPCFEKKRA
eukprot:s2255_g4.t1